MKIKVKSLVASPRNECQNEQTLKGSTDAHVESIYISNFSYLLYQLGISFFTSNIFSYKETMHKLSVFRQEGLFLTLKKIPFEECTKHSFFTMSGFIF